jgi:hypothetical protein
MFSERRTNFYDDDRSGRLSFIIADLLDQVNEMIHLSLHLKKFLAAE